MPRTRRAGCTGLGLLLAWSLMAPATAAPPPDPAPPPAVTTPAPSSAPMPITFRDAIQRVVDTSPTLQEYRARIGEATAKIREAQTPAYPTATFDAGYIRLDPAQTINLGGGAVALSVPDNYNLALTLKQAILSFGRLKWGSLAAQLGERATREEYRAQLQTQMAEAADAYINVLLAAEEVVISRKQLASRETSLRDAQALFRSGTVARFDTMRAASEVSQAQQDLLVAENQARLAKARLATLMDLPPDTNLQLEPLGEATPPPTDIEAGRQRAQDQRPEILALRWAVEASQARVRFEASQNKPMFGLQASGYSRNATGFALGEQWNTSLFLSVPLYDGGIAEARTRGAREVVKQLEAKLHSVRRDINLDVEKAWLDLHTRWKRIGVATVNLEQAEEAARVARVRYNSGVSTSVELLDTETSLTRARQLLASARFLYYSAMVAWERAISGHYPVDVARPLPSEAPIPWQIKSYAPNAPGIVPADSAAPATESVPAPQAPTMPGPAPDAAPSSQPPAQAPKKGSQTP